MLLSYFALFLRCLQQPALSPCTVKELRMGGGLLPHLKLHTVMKLELQLQAQVPP